MGLDTVELVMAFEEEFGIEIPDRDAEKIITAGDMYDYVRAGLKHKPDIECLSQKVFYKLRKALILNYGIERHLIAPDTNLKQFMSFEEIEEGWPFLQMFIDLDTPNFREANKDWFGTKSKKVLTMRSLVDRLIEVNTAKLVIEINSDEDIWRRIIDATVRQLNVNRDEIHKHSSFTKDLGAD